MREYPLRERLRGQLMLALYRTGRQADALAAYRDAHRALVDGLGIEPSPDLRELESAILRHDVAEPAQPQVRVAEPAPDMRRWVTCVCSQLTGDDAGLDPESLRAVLERFHDAARAICANHGGSIVELRNDAVVAVLGVPTAHEDDALRALRAAAELGAQAETLPFGLRARSGVCTGEVVAASGPPGAVAVIGEAVVAAERLARSAARGEIRLADSTWQVVRHAARASALADGGFRLHSLDAGAPAIGRRLDRPLIGRERELGLLRDAFDRVATGHSAELLTAPRRARHRQVAAGGGAEGDHGRAGHGPGGPLPGLRRRHHVPAVARGRPASDGRPHG